MMLFSSCLILEELIYEKLMVKRTYSFEICVPTLKRLSLTNFDKQIHINTPLVQYLQLDYYTLPINYMIRIMNKLKEAYANLYFDPKDEEEKDKILKLFNGIHKTQFLASILLQRRYNSLLKYSFLINCICINIPIRSLF